MIKNLILIDTSYVCFYRFFAIKRWYSLAHSEEYKELKDNKDYDWSTNEIFMEKYEKKYFDEIIKLIGKKNFAKSYFLFCMDSPREKIWRNLYKEDYKGDRFDLTEKYNFKPVFKYTYDKLIPQIINKYNNSSKIRINELEADDIIAIISKTVNKDISTFIISGDNDFLQLGRENLYFIKFKSKAQNITPEEAQKSLLIKIVKGDKSDGIESIFPKRTMNTKKIDELLESQEKFNNYLEKNSIVNDNFNKNRILIDFNYIPKKYIDIVNKEFSNSCKSLITK
jgi:5'-3' exonuclease